MRRSTCTVSASTRNFNPRTPVGCDRLRVVVLAALVISIHAPQWGATDRSGDHRHDLFISIHAPQWGATSAVGSSHCSRSYFNPRTPVGCDDGLATDLDARLGISIHAPQWGATESTGSHRRPARDFNPRTPVGCDWGHPRSLLFLEISIHAPQWGAT